MSLISMICAIALGLASVFLIVIIMLQESKTNMSGAITGDNSNYASKGKTMTKDLFLSKLTKYVTIGFFVVLLVVNMLLPIFDK